MKKLRKKNIQSILALTPTQEGMLFHYLKDPDSEIYFEQLCLDISGEIEKQRFEKAWDCVVDANEMLRTVFRWEKIDNPTQVTLKSCSPDLRYHDFSSLDGSVAERRVAELKIIDKQESFDLREAPFRVTTIKRAKDRYLMMISNHHILYDGWSNGIILGDFLKIYHGLARSPTARLPEKTRFGDYVRYIRNRDPQDSRTFWEGYLNGFDHSMQLSVKSTGDETITPSEHLVFPVKASTRRQWEQFNRHHQLTMANLLYSAWGLLLQRYNNTGDVIFGTTVSGRDTGAKDIENIVGLFINTPPLRVRSFPGEKISGWLQRIGKAMEKRRHYEHDSLVKIREYSELNPEERLFDTIAVIENYPLTPGTYMNGEGSINGDGGELVIDSYSSVEMTHYDLTLGINLFETMELDFSYNPRLLEKNTLERLALHYIHILNEITAKPGEAVAGIEMLSPGEKAHILVDFNDTGAAYPVDKTIPQLFEEQAGQNPDRVALVGPEPGVSLSYRVLKEQSDQLAYHLIKMGIRPDDIVGIMMNRSIEMVTGLMGILKAGGAYLPIDPNYPRERVDYMLKDSGAKAVVSTGLMVNGLDGLMVKDPGDAYELPNQQTIKPTNLAYIIYTSGSTGEPKGVMVQHSSLVNRFYWLQEKYRFDKDDVVLHKTIFTFDVSVCEIFRSALWGGRLVLMPGEGDQDPELILETMSKHRITVADFIPSAFNIFLDHLE
ncbi:MAG: AMP-binding protein, partial [bacterium]|nr:AMP-binding protein [bacterium]